MLTLTLIQKIAVWVIPVLLAITLHEAAHAWAAYRCGDNTAKMLGRLSINPLRHVDPVGTLLIPILTGFISQFHFLFGWAKPVPIQWNKLRKHRRDMAIVAAAGPIANIIMALLWAACIKTGTLLHPQTSVIAQFMMLAGQAGVFINLILVCLNLLPVPPLDGSRIVASMLPPKYAAFYMRLEPFGFLILIMLLFLGVLSQLLGPPLSWSLHLISTLFNL